MRETVSIDHSTFSSLPEFEEETVRQLEADIALLVSPGDGQARKLDAPGILNLYAIYRRLRGRD